MYGNHIIDESLTESLSVPSYIHILPECFLIIGIVMAVITIIVSIKKRTNIVIFGSVVCCILNYIMYSGTKYIGMTVEGNESKSLYIILLPIVTLIQVILLIYCIKKKNTTNIEEGEK